jgi:hypothetical protein
MKLGIKKIEYRHKDAPDDAHWTQLNIVQQSCTLAEDWSRETPGMLSTVTIQAELRRSSRQNDALLEELLRNQYHYRLTDMNGCQYITGTPDYLPQLTWQRAIGKIPKPNGYELKLTYKSPKGLSALNNS